MDDAYPNTGAMRTLVQERLAGGIGASIVVALLGYLLLLGLGVDMQVRRERPITLLDLRPPPPPLQQRPKTPVARREAKRAAGAAAPRNLKNKAAEIVTPPPLVLPPPVPVVVSAAKPGPGMAASAGASDRPGPGEGAGGEGSGTGGGGSGDGDGDGGDTPPRQLKGRLKFSDLPPALRESGAGATVSVRYRVEIDGRASGCVATASDSAELGALTCQLIERRFRFDPARDGDGRPFRSTIVENHSWVIDRSEDSPPR